MVETRHLDRDSLFLLADMLVEHESMPVRVKVRNLSAGGMMAEGPVEVARGMEVTVDIRNIGKVRGVVAWVQGRRFGLAFVREIDPKLARVQVSGGNREAPPYARAAVGANYAAPSAARLRKI